MKIGEKILNGDAEVNPYEYKQKTACDFVRTAASADSTAGFRATGCAAFGQRRTGKLFRRCRPILPGMAMKGIDSPKAIKGQSESHRQR